LIFFVGKPFAVIAGGTTIENNDEFTTKHGTTELGEFLMYFCGSV
jgi:hypothetical protein